jgi:peptide/nickel transport system substrate-binding protein
MTGRSGARRPTGWLAALISSATSAALIAACGGSSSPDLVSSSEVVLRVGVGEGEVDNPQGGIRQAVLNIAAEGLVDFEPNGRPRLILAEKVSLSPDARSWTVSIKRNATFHDGDPVHASVVRDILLAQLPRYLGQPFEDIDEIRVLSDRELEFRLREPSSFLLEALEISIRKPGERLIGTGPFKLSGDSGTEMRSNSSYYDGVPSISRILFQPYPSARSAWAEMLRGQVDMLYEAGVEALDSLERSSDIEVFTFQRPYVYAVFLNVRKKPFDSAALRRALNVAIDRKAIVDGAFAGHAIPADGPVWPLHWARDEQFAKFPYDPKEIAGESDRIRVNCIFGESSLERLALIVQQQLQPVGVDLQLESVGADPFLKRTETGDFDCAIGGVISGPNLLRPYWALHTGGPLNWGRFSSVRVDSALDAIRHAATDAEYRSGVGDLQRAILEDPPAIFLAWGERARAVSTRFDVATAGGRDVISTLRQWTPATDKRIASSN